MHCFAVLGSVGVCVRAKTCISNALVSRGIDDVTFLCLMLPLCLFFYLCGFKHNFPLISCLGCFSNGTIMGLHTTQS